MIVVILTEIVDERTRQKIKVVSHGYEYDTLKAVTLPTEEPFNVRARFSYKFGEWIIEEYPGEESVIFECLNEEENMEIIKGKKYEDQNRFR